MSVRLRDKVALVTGVSPNIGGGIAEGLAAEGAAIVALDSRAANAEDCARYINGIGGRAIAATCDVTDEAQVRAAVEAGVAAFGKIDVLVNNAAIFNKKGVLDMSLEEWRRQTDIILTGAFLCTKYVTQAMIAGDVRGGSVINIISTAGHQGEPGNIAYSTAKSGLLNFTRSAAMELVGARHPGQQPNAHGHRSVRTVRTRRTLGPPGPLGRRHDRGDGALPHRRADAAPAQAQRLWRGGGVFGVGRSGDDHRHGPARRCGRGGRDTGRGSRGVRPPAADHLTGRWD